MRICVLLRPAVLTLPHVLMGEHHRAAHTYTSTFTHDIYVTHPPPCREEGCKKESVDVLVVGVGVAVVGTGHSGGLGVVVAVVGEEKE